VNRPCPVCRGRHRSFEALRHLSGVAARCGWEADHGRDSPRHGGRHALAPQGPGAKGKGDVVVQIQVEPDRFFRREGST